MIKRLFAMMSPRASGSPRHQPSIIPRDQHNISRRDISSAALKIMQRLEQEGHQAYLVGGSVRDLLLGGHPKDFDVATDARPEQIRRLFRGARIIGRRFQIVHVRMGREIIEVTTFRGHHDQARSEDGMLLRDNVYGTVESDAARRDFTVNALYYTLSGFAIHDYTGGLKDLKARRLRIIGDPETRYKEDPVRMLRAARFAAKLGFNLEDRTAEPIPRLAPLLRNIPAARQFEEVLKLFHAGSALATFELLRDYGLLEHLFPGTHRCLEAGDASAAMIEQTLINTDKRIRSGKTTNPAFLFAALLWPPFQRELAALEGKMPPGQAWHEAASRAIGEQLDFTAIPKRFSLPMREIWDLQRRLPNRGGQRAAQLVQHPRFRAAYDFVLMREAGGEDLDGLGNWWTRYQAVDETERQRMADEAKGQRTGAGRGKPRRRRRKSGAAPQTDQ